MTINLWVPIFALAGVVITALVTWRVAARKNSGNIDFTEPQVLWGELRAELINLREREQRQDARIAGLEKALDLSRQESITSRIESAAARLESTAARKESEQLRKELAEFTKVAKVNGNG